MTTTIKPIPFRHNQQKGFSFLGFLIFAGVGIAIALLTLKIFPTVIEYNAINRAVKRSAQEGGETPAEIRRKFDQFGAIDDISSIKATDLDITKVNGKVVVAFKYEKRIPLVGPASLVLDYEGSSQSN